MVKKFRRVRTFARTASKSMEKNLIENALKLKDDPYLVLPEYTDSYSKRCFKKIIKGLDKINKFKDDVDKLEKAYDQITSRWFSHLSRNIYFRVNKHS